MHAACNLNLFDEQVTAISSLLDHGADIEARNDVSDFIIPSFFTRYWHINPDVKDGETVLHKAAYLGNIELLNLLLSKGAVLNVGDNVSICPTLLYILNCIQSNFILHQWINYIFWMVA